jgi:hypothetical protein
MPLKMRPTGLGSGIDKDRPDYSWGACRPARGGRGLVEMKAAQPPSVTIRQIEFELEKAERGMALPYDAERVGQLRKMLVAARKRKLSAGLKARRERGRR